MIHKLPRFSTLFLFLAWTSVHAAKGDADDVSQSPYFHVDGGAESLPLKRSEADISIDGAIADIRVKQTYVNESDRPIEAVYIFPGSTRAAVYGLTIKVDDRITEAQIREKAVARKEYEQAKSEGKSAALLDQVKPNVFTMNVANILPGDAIEVELRYTELLSIKDKVYELVYPTNIGHRHQASDAIETIQVPPQISDIDDGFSFDLSVSINSPIPIVSIASPSHEVDAIPYTPSQAHVQIVSPEDIPNRDFVLRYTLADNQIQSGILLHEGSEENYFLMQIEPPQRIESSSIVNREYIFILDTSGSMHGYPIETTKKLMAELLESLNPWEKFNVILFAGDASKLAQNSIDASAENIEKMKRFIDDLNGRGSNNYLAALELVEKSPIPEGYSRSVITITDGNESVEVEAFNKINKNLRNTNFFSFGVGNYINRHLIEVIARAGYGESFVAENEIEARAHGRKMLDLIRYPILSDITVDAENFDIYDVQPFYVPDLFADKPIFIMGKWRGKAKGELSISGNTGAGEWRQSIEVKSAKRMESKALEYIWARREIQQLSDLYSLEYGDKDIEKSITQLGLKHSLLTKFTSFIAVDDVVRSHGETEKVMQPQYQASSGFSLPVLSMSPLGVVAPPPSPGQLSKKVLDKMFDYVDHAWVDRKHRASMPVIEVSRTSAAYKNIFQHLEILDLLSPGEVYFIAFDHFTLKIVNRNFELGSSQLSELLSVLKKQEGEKNEG